MLGTGREIQRRGGPFRQPEWSALALYEDPSIVRLVHESFIDAGATAITTNSYAIVPFHLGQARYDKDSKWLLKLSVDLAVQARGDRSDLQIMGSIPPLCGSYEPKSFSTTTAGPILEDFLNAFRDQVDILLLETVGSVEEARFYLEAIRADLNNWIKPVPVWLSFCMTSEFGHQQYPKLLDGKTITVAIDELKDLINAEYTPSIMVNCCDVRLVTQSIQELAMVVPKGIQLGAYPNGFSTTPPDAANHSLRQIDTNISPQLLKEKSKEWMQHGATILGGCCGIGPDHIRAMAELKSST